VDGDLKPHLVGQLPPILGFGREELRVEERRTHQIRGHLLQYLMHDEVNNAPAAADQARLAVEYLGLPLFHLRPYGWLLQPDCFGDAAVPVLGSPSQCHHLFYAECLTTFLVQFGEARHYDCLKAGCGCRFVKFFYFFLGEIIRGKRKRTGPPLFQIAPEPVVDWNRIPARPQ
jgi:hypothetical protein